ncbi:hypothetical protein HHK36_027316 [Tetracentron sinense]|uniref:14-3-3 domain-containing protein n=1 Tax=Tetracentron sinense TaxID=13715 RepID=A0A835D699_TETSI|nr:hypothetical protein HHK36_027316 [Tetracentron sinense]
MVNFMEKLVVRSSSVGELTVEERNLLSLAYKNVIRSLCATWCIIFSIEQKEEGRKNEEHISLVEEYRSKVTRTVAVPVQEEQQGATIAADIVAPTQTVVAPTVAAPVTLRRSSRDRRSAMSSDYEVYLNEGKS